MKIFLKNNIKKIELIIMLLATICTTIFIYNYFERRKLTIIIGLILGLLIIFDYFFKEKMNKLLNQILKFRYLIALFIFIICVIFKLHGSSIGMYNYFFDNSTEYNNKSIIYGTSRSIRSDEYNVHTPYYMSQYYNDYNKKSHMMSISGQDMIIGYNAPVKDLSLIGKPFTWGYILLGNEYGLSWYWCLKLILLILVSYELSMIITQKNQKISILGVFLLAFSPCMQWWFVPHMCDVFFWGMTILTLSYHFFTTKNKILKNLFTIILPLSVSTFVIALFPSLQITVGLVSIALLITFLIRDKKEITFEKKDIIRLIIMALIVIAILGQFIYTSLDSLKLLFNTVYPGKRISLGGDLGFKALFTDLTTFYLPYKEITYSNNCEISTFIQFAPLFMFLYPLISKKLKNNKNLIVGRNILICIIVAACFMMIGFPYLLSKITLFSYVNRMQIAYGYIATLFTIWAISFIWDNKTILTNKKIITTSLLYGLCYIFFISKEELSYMNIYYYIIVIFGLIFLCFLLLNKRKKLFTYLLILVVMVSSFTINPIAHGTSSLTEHPLEKKIKEITNEDKKAYWLAINKRRLTTSIAIVNGAQVINACNFYPDYEKWDIIDEKREYDYFYNRYAHIVIDLSIDDTSIKKISEDVIEVNLNYDDFMKLPVKYILSDRKLDDELKTSKIEYEMIYEDSEGEYYIYLIKK